MRRRIDIVEASTRRLHAAPAFEARACRKAQSERCRIMPATRTRSLGRPEQFLALLLALAIWGSCGCVYRLPLRDYEFDATADEGLGGCPDLAGTYKVTGHANDYLILGLVLPILPVWWERNPAQPRLDKDLGLVLHKGTPSEIAGVQYVMFAQPDADHIVITLLNESRLAVKNWDEIVLATRGSAVAHVYDPRLIFSCWKSRDNAPILGIARRFVSGETPYPAGTRYIGQHPDGNGSLLLHTFDSQGFFYTRGWHWYEKVVSPKR